MGAFIIHMRVCFDKTFLLVQYIFASWCWPWSWTYILKTLTLPNLFNARWYALSISYAYFLWQDLHIGTLNFDILTLGFDDYEYLRNLSFTRAFVFHNTSCHCSSAIWHEVFNAFRFTYRNISVFMKLKYVTDVITICRKRNVQPS
jgi:hypothetical protein